MNLRHSVSGILQAALTSADLTRSLEQLILAGVELRKIQSVDELTARFWIQRKDKRAADKVMEKRGEDLKIIQEYGLRQTMARIIRRPVLCLGILVLWILTMYLPQRVLFISVEGNEVVPTAEILNAAADCGLRFGTVRKEVRSEQMKNRILAQIPQLQWVGINTLGCTATISVADGNPEPTESPGREPWNLVAVCDGFVLEQTVLKGTALCAPGQAVTKGQVLISGYTDCGLHIRAEAAEGEVYALTQRTLSAQTLEKAWVVSEENRKTTGVSILFGKKRINLWKGSGICPPTCGRMYKEIYITLPGGFALPLGIALEETRFRSLEPHLLETSDQMARWMQDYLLAHITAGRILSGQEIEWQGIFTGTYICREMISVNQQEQIGVQNE